MGENFEVLTKDLKKCLNYKIIEKKDEDYEKGMLLLQIHRSKLHIMFNNFLGERLIETPHRKEETIKMKK